jgi:hypothetical protein
VRPRMRVLVGPNIGPKLRNTVRNAPVLLALTIRRNGVKLDQATHDDIT